jgi:hypothetical protein
MRKNHGRELFTQILVCLVFVLDLCFAQPNEAATRLSTDLMKNYNKMIRGVKDTDEITTLNVSFSLIRISEFDEVNGKLSLVGYFSIYWHDYRMEWDPKDYNDTQTILFSEKDVWRPLIVLVSPHKEFEKLGNDNDFFVRFNPDGTAQWHPGDLWTTSCTPDVYKYPFDTQSCVVTYDIWDYAVYEVTIKTLFDKVRLHVYSTHGMWDLIDTSVKSIVDVELERTRIDITLVMKRISTFHLINMILPIVFIGLLNVLVFLLPAQAGGRAGYSVTVLVAIAVFQTIASENLPSVSKPRLSLLCIKLLVDLILSSIVTTLTIVTLYFYHMPNCRRVPTYVAIFTKCVLCKNCCRNKTKAIREDKYKKHCYKNGVVTTEAVSVYDNNLGDVTWTDVGKCSDVLFSVFSLFTFLASNIVFVLYVV